MFNNIYEGKKIFLTGHTGFKGAWLALWLKSLRAEVLGYSLKPQTKPSLFNILNLGEHIQSIFGNICDKEKLEQTMQEFKPDMVFHLAAQAIVRLSYFEPYDTYQSNVIGTLNMLEAARKCPSVKAFVNITTDKCYENKEVEYGYREDDTLGGHDMYSSSKACAEILSSSYRLSFLKGAKPYAMATARAGNVIGGGDWALDRLVPDCVRFIEKNEKISIRNPIAVRPWQHVLEPLSGYLLLGEKLLLDGKKYAQAYNFGPEESNVMKVADVAQKVVNLYGKGEVIFEKNDDLHEAGLLILNKEKAEKMLNWKPSYNTDMALDKAVSWYKQFYSQDKIPDNIKLKNEMTNYTLQQIKEFEENCSFR